MSHGQQPSPMARGREVTTAESTQEQGVQSAPTSAATAPLAFIDIPLMNHSCLARTCSGSHPVRLSTVSDVYSSPLSSSGSNWAYDPVDSTSNTFPSRFTLRQIASNIKHHANYERLCHGTAHILVPLLHHRNVSFHDFTAVITDPNITRSGSVSILSPLLLRDLPRPLSHYVAHPQPVNWFYPAGWVVYCHIDQSILSRRYKRRAFSHQ